MSTQLPTRPWEGWRKESLALLKVLLGLGAFFAVIAGITWISIQVFKPGEEAVLEKVRSAENKLVSIEIRIISKQLEKNPGDLDVRRCPACDWEAYHFAAGDIFTRQAVYMWPVYRWGSPGYMTAEFPPSNAEIGEIYKIRVKYWSFQ